MIDRRALVNFRIEPGRLRDVLPAPFRPQLVRGWAIGGICLIRLRDIRPAGLPGAIGLRSENAAHRIAVEWDQGSERRTGVYIPRRDSSSFVNTLLGGRIFPGHHHRARFEIDEEGDRVSIEMRSNDGGVRIALLGHVADTLAEGSVLGSIDEVSTFFRKDPVGYSPSRGGGLEGFGARDARMGCVAPRRRPRRVVLLLRRRSVPRGSVEVDDALLMRNVGHRWHVREDLYDW